MNHRLHEDIGPCLSVVVPCYNEEQTVLESVARVLAQPFVNQVVIVDDCSTDRTHSLVSTLDDERVTVIHHDRNRGKGAALRTGFAEAAGPFVAVHDADLEYDPADLSLLLPPLIRGEADVVYGSRFLTTEARRVLYFWHSVGNRILTLCSNMLTNLNLTDMETCYKVFRRDVLDRITIEEDRFGVEPELTAKVAALGCRVFEVGISYSGRSYAEGKKIGWRDGVRAMVAMTKYTAKGRAGAGRARRAAAFHTADEALAETLHDLDAATNYASWIMELIRPHLGSRVLEVGAGHGSFSRLLAGACDELVVSEPSPRAVELLRSTLSDEPNISVVGGSLAELEPTALFDSVVMVNVLEHIEDDGKALRQTAELLTDGGRVVLYVPAFELLYSPYDAAVGHHRRYRREQLVALLEESGFRVADARYVNSAGFLAWLVTARLLRVRPTRRGLALAYDRTAVPALRRVEQVVNPPVGQSLLAVGVREA